MQNPPVHLNAATIVRVREHDTALTEQVGRLLVDVYGGEGHASGAYLSVLVDAAARVREAVVLAAVDGEDLLGTVTYAVAPNPWANVARTGEAEFRMLATAPAARRRGVARALVDACRDLAIGDACPVLRLSTGSTMTAAHALYEALGFERTPGLDWEPVPGDRLRTYALPVPSTSVTPG